jgi:hypothetical protein
MNRGFGYYFKKSSDLVSFVFGKQKFKDKFAFLLYVVASTICKLFFLTRPLFLIADQNMANMIVNGHSFSILKAFHGTKERYFKIFFAELVEGTIYFALALVILIPCAFPFLILTNTAFGIVFVVLGAIAWLITCFALSYNYRFVDYVAAKNKELDFSDYLYNSRVSIRGFKGLIFGNDLVSFILGDLIPLLFVALAFLCGTVLLAVIFTTFNNAMIAELVCFVLILLLALGFVLYYFNVAAPIKMRKIVFIYLIATDNCKTSRSIVVKRKSSNRVEYEPLFDEQVKSQVLDINK